MNTIRTKRSGVILAAVVVGAWSFAFIGDGARADMMESAVHWVPPNTLNDAAGWEKIRESDGVVVHGHKVEGTPIVALRGEGIIDAPIAKVANILFDDKRKPEWADSYREAWRVRKLSENAFVEYSHIGTPITVRDRDFVCETELAFDAQAKTVTAHVHSVSDPLAPETRFVRGVLHDGGYRLESIDGGTRTRVVVYMSGDPKGAVPTWFVNLFQRSWPVNTIRALRKQALKADIADVPEVRAGFERSHFFQ